MTEPSGGRDREARIAHLAQRPRSEAKSKHPAVNARIAVAGASLSTTLGLVAVIGLAARSGSDLATVNLATASAPEPTPQTNVVVVIRQQDGSYAVASEANAVPSATTLGAAAPAVAQVPAVVVTTSTAAPAAAVPASAAPAVVPTAAIPPAASVPVAVVRPTAVPAAAVPVTAVRPTAAPAAATPPTVAPAPVQVMPVPVVVAPAAEPTTVTSGSK